MPTEDLESFNPRFHPNRRYEDQHRQSLNWSMVGVLLAFTVNACMAVWIMASMNAATRQSQVDIAELKAGISTLMAAATNNSVRIGVLESKVDDIRDVRKEHTP